MRNLSVKFPITRSGPDLWKNFTFLPDLQAGASDVKMTSSNWTVHRPPCPGCINPIPFQNDHLSIKEILKRAI